MPEPLTLARFQELADAYGGVVTRWPEQHREAAMAMASQPGARATPLRPRRCWMRLWTYGGWLAPAYSLRDRVIRSAPVTTGKIVTRGRLWWSGVGIVAALAGATAGTAAVAIASPIDASSDSATSFGDVAGPET